MRYVVCVKPPDDHPAAVRVFGTWREPGPAAEFRDKVREALDSVPADIAADAEGYAYLMSIEAPRVRQATAWALRGEDLR